MSEIPGVRQIYNVAITRRFALPPFRAWFAWRGNGYEVTAWTRKSARRRATALREALERAP